MGTSSQGAAYCARRPLPFSQNAPCILGRVMNLQCKACTNAAAYQVRMPANQPPAKPKQAYHDAPVPSGPPTIPTAHPFDVGNHQPYNARSSHKAAGRHMHTWTNALGSSSAGGWCPTRSLDTAVSWMYLQSMGLSHTPLPLILSSLKTWDQATRPFLWS